MKRWRLPAGVSVASGLVQDEVATPEPGAGQVRIEVRALSINARDLMVVGEGPFGRTPDRDLVPLSDVAGRIDAIGPDVDEFAVGDMVTNLHFLGWDDGPPPMGLGLGLGALEEDGVYAEYVVLPQTRVTRAPANLSPLEAACIPVAGVTAWNAVFGDHPLRSGGSMVTIGSGGVALFALQLASFIDAEVYAAVREDGAGRRLVDLGAKVFLNTSNVKEWGADVFKRSGGVSKFVNSIGTSMFDNGMAALGNGGEMAVLGLFDTETQAFDAQALIAKQAVIRGVSVGSNGMHRELVAFIEKHDLHPMIYRRFRFEDAVAAFGAQQDRGIFGKVVIEVG